MNSKFIKNDILKIIDGLINTNEPKPFAISGEPKFEEAIVNFFENNDISLTEHQIILSESPLSLNALKNPYIDGLIDIPSLALSFLVRTELMDNSWYFNFLKI